ncbi:MAG: transposase family protein, partial [Cyanothece sp. SIO1E1]|nr:transposase family protein [Cyanothece sp. SIO1E1]
MDDTLIYILCYFKCYPTFDLAEALFELDRSQTNRWMRRLQSILEAALANKKALSKRLMTVQCPLQPGYGTFILLSITIILSIVRTVLLRSRKKAVHRYRVRLQQNQVAPMDSFSGILTGLL